MVLSSTCNTAPSFVATNVGNDGNKRQEGAAIFAEERQSINRSRCFDDLAANKGKREQHPCDTHGDANGTAGHSLDRFLDTLINIVGHRDVGRYGMGRAMLEVIVRMVAVEQCIVEALIKPSTPLAVQRRRKIVPDRDEAYIAKDHNRGKYCGALQDRS